jgi:hypothetical protein
VTTIAIQRDISPERQAAITRINTRADQVRGLFATDTAFQDMIYLEKAAEASRFLTAYPTPADVPEAIDDNPVTGFPFIAAEIGITGPDAWTVASTYAQGAAQFRQVGAIIDRARLGAIAVIEQASGLTTIAAAEAQFAAAMSQVIAFAQASLGGAA